ncbi:MAG TPA: hypothetical protein VHH36_07900 [Candidatus Thermoplasmatota archaeon]|nr:hypothetical protein [Candidatus Thermoplasmatota archaeon]
MIRTPRRAAILILAMASFALPLPATAGPAPCLPETIATACVPACAAEDACFRAIRDTAAEVEPYDPCDPIFSDDDSPCPTLPPVPGAEKCVGGTLGWCFQPVSVGQVPPPGGTEPGCYAGAEAVTGPTYWLSRMPDALSAQVGRMFQASWRLEHGPSGQALDQGSAWFVKWGSDGTSSLYRSAVPIPGSAAHGSVGDCDQLWVTAPGPCAFHCGEVWLRYV